MERQEKFIEFVYGQRYLKLKWSPEKTSEEMVMDAIDTLGKVFLEYFNSSYLNFLVIDKKSPQGRITSIETIVSSNISLIFIRGPDAKRNNTCIIPIVLAT
jgi:predicted heme/steroid binding protein